MKRVSLKVAKSLKEAGYPQIFIDYAYYEDNKLHHTEDPYNNCRKIIAYAPTYLDAWLWLWREKKIYLNTNTQRKGIVCVYWDDTIIHEVKDMKLTDPEEAIASAIENMVDNDLVK